MLLFWSFFSSNNPEKQNIVLTKILSNTTVLNINNNKKHFFEGAWDTEYWSNDCWKFSFAVLHFKTENSYFKL